MQRSISGRMTKFPDEDLIVSKTDLRGIITYVNDVFVRVSGYPAAELVGRAHNIIRHPRMPRCVFRLLWDTIQARQEIFAYVLNRCKNGDEYWVFAHVTPSYSSTGAHVGYHSNRRSPFPDALPRVESLYAELLRVEAKFPKAGDATQAGLETLNGKLDALGADYATFVFGLSRHTSLQRTAS